MAVSHALPTKRALLNHIRNSKLRAPSKTKAHGRQGQNVAQVQIACPLVARGRLVPSLFTTVSFDSSTLVIHGRGHGVEKRERNT